MNANDTTTVHLKESLWATRTVCDEALAVGDPMPDQPASIYLDDTTCQECLTIAHTVRNALTPDEAAEPRRILVRNDEIVTIPVSDEAQKILATFWKDSLTALAVMLEPVGLDPTDIAMPTYYQALFTDSLL